MNHVNFHTHSHYCDGKGELRDYVDYALAHGFVKLGFSGHCPLPFVNTFSIHDEDYLSYCYEVRALQQNFAGRLDIRLGLEMDYIPGVHDDFRPLIEKGNLDYYLGGVHLVTNPDDVDWLRDHPAEAAERIWFIDGPRQETYDEGLQRVFGGDARRGVTAFFRQTCEMLESQRPPIIAHFNKIVMHNHDRYFSEQDVWYRALVGDTLALIRELGTIVEVNTRGLYKKRYHDFYPSRELLKEMRGMHIPVLVGTDAHEPGNLDQFEGAYTFLQEIGYPPLEDYRGWCLLRSH